MSEWISVKERLPEIWQNVLVYRKDNEPHAEFRCFSGGWDMDEKYRNPVTHWMPFPEPPKEG